MPPVLRGTSAERILEIIVRHCGEHCGRAPTNREIGKLAGISSTSVVNYHLNRLQRAGVIRRDKIASRAIEIVGATWAPPAHLESYLAPDVLVAHGEAAHP